LRANELVQQNEYMLDHPGTDFLTKISRKLSGGLKISRKLWVKFTGRPMTTPLPTSRTQNSFSKTSSTGTSTPEAKIP
jgi:hypothetical protein